MEQRIKALLPSGLLAFAQFGVAAAGPLEDSRAAYERGDYATAMAFVRPLADGGDAAAQRELGYLYGMLAIRDHHSQDFTQGAIWFRKAADQGDAKAQIYLGTMYSVGRGVPQDYVMAHMWYNLAERRVKILRG